MRAGIKWAEQALDGLAVVLFAVMFGVVILQIVLRYVFNAPLVWTDELAQYLFVWTSFLGWTMATRKRIHIGISVVADHLPAAGRRMPHALRGGPTLAVAIILLVVGVLITRRDWDVQIVSLGFSFL